MLAGALGLLAPGAQAAPVAPAAPADAHAPAASPAPAWFADQETELRTVLAPTAAVIEHADRAVIIHCPARIAFAADRAELLPAGTAVLDALARSLREYKRTQLVVAVYTDTIGSSEFNQQQAQARAGVVVDYLQLHGIAPERLVARGVGEAAQLPAPNTPEGRDLNRRLELTITPLSS
ncbi:MAG: OmpA family protein [Proteobacteria bacterium]|nr:OmpA family protein [Pseudomonadota bacterium]